MKNVLLPTDLLLKTENSKPLSTLPYFVWAIVYTPIVWGGVKITPPPTLTVELKELES